MTMPENVQNISLLIVCTHDQIKFGSQPVNREEKSWY